MHSTMKQRILTFVLVLLVIVLTVVAYQLTAESTALQNKLNVQLKEIDSLQRELRTCNEQAQFQYNSAKRILDKTRLTIDSLKNKSGKD